jgi:hypothetical protein
MTEESSSLRRLHGLKRWLYRGDRPHGVAKFLNSYWARQYGSAGRFARPRDVELVVRGRTSGESIAIPVVLTDISGQWYAVSMLGANANWVRNVRAAHGRAKIRHGATWSVQLTDVPKEGRAPILKRYLEVAPGARPHLPVDRSAPISEFERIAIDYPVFRVDDFVPDDQQL